MGQCEEWGNHHSHQWVCSSRRSECFRKPLSTSSPYATQTLPPTMFSEPSPRWVSRRRRKQSLQQPRRSPNGVEQPRKYGVDRLSGNGLPSKMRADGSCLWIAPTWPSAEVVRSYAEAPRGPITPHREFVFSELVQARRAHVDVIWVSWSVVLTVRCLARLWRMGRLWRKQRWACLLSETFHPGAHAM